jgi:hypothetical protein
MTGWFRTIESVVSQDLKNESKPCEQKQLRILPLRVLMNKPVEG